MSNATILTSIASQITTLGTALTTLDADPTNPTKKTAALVAGELARKNASMCLGALVAQRKATARVAIAALLDDVPHLPVECRLEDHAVLVTGLTHTTTSSMLATIPLPGHTGTIPTRCLIRSGCWADASHACRRHV
jgi:hypothetical protein